MKILFFLFFPLICFAKIQVAFLEKQDSNGLPMQFEANGKFIHTAISYHDQWLHSHPHRGVALTDFQSLKDVGHVAKVIVISENQELEKGLVQKLLGRPFDSQLSWSDEAFYCSELIGKILNLTPKPMVFDPKLWPAYFQKYSGQPGISPDEIYRQLLAKGYKAY